MTARTVEDRLREAYFGLLPDVRAALVELEALASYAVMPVALQLKQRHERLVLRSRVKECESAIGSLRRREEAKQFDPSQPEKYRLDSLPDLAGTRVFVFPSAPIESVREAMESAFPSWAADHVVDPRTGSVLAWKHHGFCPGNPHVRCEYQIVPMLIGLFWDVEHAAIYKPDRNLIGVTHAPLMQERTHQVYAALKDFEEEFTRQIEAASG
jgi:hypothetical protein